MIGNALTAFSTGLMQIRYLGLAGGSNVAETVRAVMKRLVSSGVAKQLNWRGIGGKESFAALNIRATVCGQC